MTMGSRASGRTKELRAASGAASPGDARAEAEDFGVSATVHGGRLAAAMAAYPRAPRPWLDLSTGINPEPWRGPRAPYELLSRLPDPLRIAELEAAAAVAFGVADAARVVAVAGAEAGLRLLPRVLGADAVDVVSPTYSSHEAAWRSGLAQVFRITAERIRASAADVLLLVNPNNPDGHAVDRDLLEAVVVSRARRRLWTVVDESFVETRPELSVAGVASDRLVVLRSFGKFYGLPGLRLGFVIAPPELAVRLREVQGEWPVSAEAAFMGIKAYGDMAWREAMRDSLARDAADLDDLLEARGLRVLGGTSLFRLASAPDACAVFKGLCRAGVLTRPFARREEWIRFGLPRREDFARLDLALRQIAR